jgi:hypothetical protein
MLGLKDVKREHMKKLALVFVVALGFTSCDNVSVVAPSPNQKEIESASRTYTNTIALQMVKFQGHDYVVMEGYNKGCICHSESCPCKNK